MHSLSRDTSSEARVVAGEMAAMCFQIVAAYILAAFCVGQIVYGVWKWCLENGETDS